MTARSFGPKSTGDEVLAGLDLGGKRIVVTGATSGIGVETARSLAAHGAEVFVGARDPARGAAVVRDIVERHRDASVSVLPLDLASFASIRAAADELGDAPIDTLIANAGVYGGGRQHTEEGFERTVGVCHIGHFLLFTSLRERLLAAPSPRLVMVSSESHRTPKRLPIDRLPRFESGYSDLRSYGAAKLCNVLFALEVERRYGDQGLHAYALHPGNLIATGIARDSLLAKVAVAAAKPFSKSLAQGAATSVYCATAPELEGTGGRYFDSCREKRPTAEALREDLARDLWTRTESWIAEATAPPPSSR